MIKTPFKKDNNPKNDLFIVDRQLPIKGQGVISLKIPKQPYIQILLFSKCVDKTNVFPSEDSNKGVVAKDVSKESFCLELRLDSDIKNSHLAMKLANGEELIKQISLGDIRYPGGTREKFHCEENTCEYWISIDKHNKTIIVGKGYQLHSLGLFKFNINDMEDIRYNELLDNLQYIAITDEVYKTCTKFEIDKDPITTDMPAIIVNSNEMTLDKLDKNLNIVPKLQYA